MARDNSNILSRMDILFWYTHTLTQVRSPHTEEGLKYSKQFVQYQSLLIVLLITTHITALCERTVKPVIPVDSVILLECIGKVKIGAKDSATSTMSDSNQTD